MVQLSMGRRILQSNGGVPLHGLTHMGFTLPWEVIAELSAETVLQIPDALLFFPGWLKLDRFGYQMIPLPVPPLLHATSYTCDGEWCASYPRGFSLHYLSSSRQTPPCCRTGITLIKYRRRNSKGKCLVNKLRKSTVYQLTSDQFFDHIPDDYLTEYMQSGRQ